MLPVTGARKTTFLKPVLPLVPEVIPKSDDNQRSIITMELKSQAGTATSANYKKKIALFDEGTPQEWIDTQRDILEVWRQNSITVPADRVSIIKAVLRGETMTTFVATLDELRIGADGGFVAITMDMVNAAMTEVAKTIFPIELWKTRNTG
jgi:hypothetical protein